MSTANRVGSRYYIFLCCKVFLFLLAIIIGVTKPNDHLASLGIRVFEVIAAGGRKELVWSIVSTLAFRRRSHWC